jgi:pimeloyl-ACP methyl ester carboxylesterase
MAREVEVREGRVEVAPGVRLWFRAAGDGPAVVCQNGVGVTITFWEGFAERIARRGYTSVIWDYRGHGRSDEPRDLSEVALATCVEDLAKVMDAAGVERACLLGHSMGAQLGWEFYRRFPERVSGLVPTLGTYRDAISSFYDLPQIAPRVFGAASFLVNRVPGLAKKFTALAASQPALSDAFIRKLNIVHPTLSPRDWLPAYLQHMARLDPRVFFALAREIRDHDASDLLPKIRVPVLIVAGERDFFCPPRVAREMAELIPGAELMIIPGGSHAATIEQPDLFDLRVGRFLATRVYPEFRPLA